MGIKTSQNLMPHFETVDGRKIFYVDGRPFTVLAVEIPWWDLVHGRYAEAEKLLAAAAASAPGSDAALELGRLQLYLGKRTEGNRTLERLISASPQNKAADLVRVGEAGDDRRLDQVAGLLPEQDHPPG